MYFDYQGTVVVAGRARAVVVGVGANTAMGSIRDSMLQTDDVRVFSSLIFYYMFSLQSVHITLFFFNLIYTLTFYIQFSSIKLASNVNIIP